ncbi:MAG: aminoacyl--tRNA ligase-related protein [Patescibacteria group bacterium]
MRYTTLFGTTSKTAPHDADSANARLLVQGGFVDQLMAGVFTYLPLGLKTLDKIKNIIRDEMDKIGGQEILMPALLPKEPWEQTGRWTDPGPEVMFRVEGRGEKEFGLGWTHEEIVTPLAKKFIRSYKDLPFAVYQIQDKFRNEPRAKSGLLRGREFSMKDLYSFHRDEADLDRYYEEAKAAYLRVYDRCGLHALVVEASGGAFSKYSHEFQVLTESGEDVVFYCGACEYAQNREISEYKAGDECPKCGGEMKEGKAIEVGNIFKLKTRFTEAFGVSYDDADGNKKPVLMGCYGIGPSRVMGTIAEVHSDVKGLRWPKSVAPMDVHLVMLTAKEEAVTDRVKASADKLYEELSKAGVSVLFDDRTEARAGEKFADADLIGLPLRLVLSEKTVTADIVEWKERAGAEAKSVVRGGIVAAVKDFLS